MVYTKRMSNAAISIPNIRTGDRFWHNGTAYVASGNALAIVGSVRLVVPVECPNDNDNVPALELHRAGHVARR